MDMPSCGNIWIQNLWCKVSGNIDPDMMWLTTMNPETRRLIRVSPAEAEATSQMFDLLLGDNLSGRKDFISQNGHLYLDDLDLS